MFQETFIQHTSLAPVVDHWNRFSLLNENITDSQGYVGGAKVESPLHVQMRGIYSYIAKGEFDPCDSSTLMTV